MDAVFIECFGKLTGPRVDRTKKHLLLDILALSICGVLSGAENWEEIEDFAKEHEHWFGKFLLLPHGIPSHDTISRVFSALDPNGLQTSCINWLKRISQLIAEDIIAVDGKSLCGPKRVNECKKSVTYH
jgi:DDE_Tnp_1-associated